jgi:general secretion pathway protein L
MAHVITGLDVGAHSIKVVCIDAGFRRSKVIAAFEELIPAGDEPLEVRQRAAIKTAMEKIGREAVILVAMPGDRLAVRVLELPFADPRKVEQVIPFELEGQIVTPLEEVVYDHRILEGDGEETRVLSVAARIDDLGKLLEGYKELGVSPRSVFAAPVMYRSAHEASGAVADDIPLVGDEDVTLVAGAADVGPKTTTDARGLRDAHLVLDLGDSRTNVVVLQKGIPVFARTLTRGGRHLTAALAAAFHASPAEAEQAKVSRGIVQHPGFATSDRVAEQMARVLYEAAVPLLRDIRQTLASFNALFGATISKVSLVGGGAAQRGLPEMLAAELGILVVPWDGWRGIGAEDDAVVPDVRFALAEAMAWAGVRGSREIDLRKGPFVYRASFSVVRQRAWHLAGLAAAVLLSAAIDGTMSYTRLHQEKDKLEAELERATTELFGKSDTNARSVAQLLKKGFREELPPIPDRTAFDLMEEISRRMPSKEQIKLDVLELDIRPKKTHIKGTIDSVAAVDQVVDALDDIACFEEITKGSITEVSGGAKQFTLTIATKCP